MQPAFDLAQDGLALAVRGLERLHGLQTGLVELTVVDDFIARFWHQVFPSLELFETAAVRSGGSIGVAVRKNNPRLLQAVKTKIEPDKLAKKKKNVAAASQPIGDS